MAVNNLSLVPSPALDPYSNAPINMDEPICVTGRELGTTSDPVQYSALWGKPDWQRAWLNVCGGQVPLYGLNQAPWRPGSTLSIGLGQPATGQCPVGMAVDQIGQCTTVVLPQPNPPTVPIIQGTCPSGFIMSPSGICTTGMPGTPQLPGPTTAVPLPSFSNQAPPPIPLSTNTTPTSVAIQYPDGWFWPVTVLPDTPPFCQGLPSDPPPCPPVAPPPTPWYQTGLGLAALAGGAYLLLRKKGRKPL